MKKKIIITLVVIVALVASAYFLFCPKSIIATYNVMNDGGSEVYDAPLLKMIKWNKLTENGTYEHTSYYLYPNNQKTPDELWEIEQANIKK